MRVLLAGAILVTLLGCEEKKPSATLPSAVPTRTGLSVDGKTVETKTALAIGTTGEASLRVVIPDTPLTCEDLEGAYPERPGMPGRRIDFWVRRPWEPKGEGPWEIRSTFVSEGDETGHGCVLRGAMVDDVVETPDGYRLKDLDLAAQDSDHLYQWAGDLVVERCGRQARPEDDHPQPDLKLSIGGRSIEVHGATVRPQGERMVIRLTRAPHACASAITEGFDFYLDLAVEGSPPRLAFGSLLGDVFPEEPSSSEGKETFRISAEEPLAGTGEVEVGLDGELTIGGFPVKLEGEATLQRCTPSPPAAASASAAPTPSAAPAPSASR